jgi:hypothetical protein
MVCYGKVWSRIIWYVTWYSILWRTRSSAVGYAVVLSCVVWCDMECYDTKWYGIDSILCYFYNGFS